VLGVGADQGQGEEVDLVEKRLETLVLRGPCANLGYQVFGYVDGVSLSVLFAGDVLGVVERPSVMATTFQTAAAVRVEREIGGEHRPGSSNLADPAVKHAANKRGVLGDVHDVFH